LKVREYKKGEKHCFRSIMQYLPTLRVGVRKTCFDKVASLPFLIGRKETVVGGNTKDP